jgi:hypothetical protein
VERRYQVIAPGIPDRPLEAMRRHMPALDRPADVCAAASARKAGALAASGGP